MNPRDGLMRVQSWVLDERRQRLSEIEAFAARLGADLEALERQLAERPGGPDDPRPARRAKLRATITELEREIQVARGDLKETCEELEEAEQAQSARAASKLKRRPRREARPDGEHGVGLYRRRKAAGDL